MKGHKAHHHREHKAAGGEAHGDAPTGKKEWEEDLKSKPERYGFGKPEDAAEERKRGGRAKRKLPMKVHGEAAKEHAGRKPRKSGGRAGSNANPLSSAHKGVLPPHHKDANID